MIRYKNSPSGFLLYGGLIAAFVGTALAAEVMVGLALCRVPQHYFLSFWQHAANFLIPGTASAACNSAHLYWESVFLVLAAAAGAFTAHRIARHFRSVRDLMQSEHRYKEALRVVHEGVFEWAYPSDQAYCSDTFFALCGYDRPGGFIPLAEKQTFIHPDDREYDSRQLTDAISNYAQANYQIRLRHRDGHYFAVHIRGKVHTVDAFRQLYYIVGTIRNLSADEVARQEIDQINSRLGVIASLEDEGLCELSSPDLIIRHNFSPKAKLGGMSLQLLVNRPLSQLLGEKEFAELNNWLRKNTPRPEDNLPHQLDTILEPEPGRSLPVRLLFTKGIHNDANIVLMRIRDLSEEYNANITTMILKHAADRLLIGLVIIRQDGRLYYSNKRARQSLPELEDTTSNFVDLFPGISFKRLQRLIARTRRRGHYLFPYELNGIPFEIDCDYLNISTGFVSFLLRDLTQYQQKVQQMNQMLADESQANQKRLMLLNSVNYELRKPLSGILGFADLLRDPTLSQEERDDYLATIITSGNRLLKLWTGVLELMSLESGEVEVKNETLNLNSLFNSIETSYAGKVGKNIQFRIQKTSRDVDANIISDEGILLQIFDRLLDNALHFTSKGWRQDTCWKENS